MGEDDARLQENRYPLILRLSLPFLMLSYLAVLARLLARKFMRNSPGADDVMIIVASVSLDPSALSLTSLAGKCVNAVGFQHLRFCDHSSS